MKWNEKLAFEKFWKFLNEYLMKKNSCFIQMVTILFENEQINFQQKNILLKNFKNNPEESMKLLRKILENSLEISKFLLEQLKEDNVNKELEKWNNFDNIWMEIIEDLKRYRRQNKAMIKLFPFRNAIPIEDIIEINCPKQSIGLKRTDLPGNFNRVTFFELSTINFKKIVIQGEEGYGKTVQMKSILNEWATNGNVGFKDKLLLVIDFGKVKQQERNFFREIKIQNFKFNDAITPEIIEEFFKTHKHEIILLLDEVEELYSEDHPFRHYIDDDACDVTTIIWTRTWKASSIRRLCMPDAIYELIGLTKENFNLFIRKLIIDNSESINFLETISNRYTRLLDYCKSPLWVGMIFFVYLQKKNLDEDNLYTIYDYILNYIINQNTDVSASDNEEILQAKKFIDDEVCFTCYLNVIEAQSKIYLEQEYYFKARKYLKGLLDDENYCKPEELNKQEIKFFHSSFQEFFVAKHLVYSKNKENDINTLLRSNRKKIFKILNLFKQKNQDEYLRICQKIKGIKGLFYCSKILLEEINKIHTSTVVNFQNEYFPDYAMEILVEIHGSKWVNLSLLQCNLNKEKTKILLETYCSDNLKSLILRDSSIEIQWNNSYFIEGLKYFKIKNLQYLEYKNIEYKMLTESKKFNRNDIFNSQKISFILHSSKSIITLQKFTSSLDEYCIIELYKNNHNLHPSIFVQNFHILQELIVKNWLIDEYVINNLFKSIQKRKILKFRQIKIYLFDCLLLNVDKEFFKNFSKLISEKPQINYSSDKNSSKNSILISKNYENSCQIFLNPTSKYAPATNLFSKNTSFDALATDKNLASIVKIDHSIYDSIFNDDEKRCFKELYHIYLNNSTEVNLFEFSRKIHLKSSVNNFEKLYLNNLNDYDTKLRQCLSFINFECLQEIHSSNINLNNYEFFEYLFSKINSQIHTLTFKNCFINDFLFGEIFNGKYFYQIKKLVLKSCLINTKKCIVLDNFFQLNRQLEEFNLSKNSGINSDGFKKIFHGIKYSANSIKIVNLSDCNLSKERAILLGEVLSKFSGLFEINLSFNCMQIGFKTVCEGLLASSSCLGKINLAGCDLDEIDSEYLCKLLEHCSTLTELNLNYNSRLKCGFRNIFERLKICNKSLRNLYLSSCNIEEKISINLGQLFSSCMYLEKVNLNMNCEIDWSYILKGLESSSETIHILKLTGCQLNGSYSTILFNFLQKCSNLNELFLGLNFELEEIFNNTNFYYQHKKILNIRKLDLHACNLRNPKYLGQFLKACIFLNEINFSWNFFYENSFKNIFSGLYSSINSLKKINFSHCNINDENGKIIGEFLKSCLILEDVNFSYNKNFNEGLNEILRSLQFSVPYLKRINLSNCCLNEKNCEILSLTLTHCSLLELNISFNKLNSQQKLSNIFLGLKNSQKSLQILILSGCNLNNKHTIFLGNLLKNFSSLEELNLAFNTEINEKFDLIIPGLKSLKNLKKLNFKSISLTDGEMRQLENLLKNTPTIKEIHVTGKKKFRYDSIATDFQILSENLTRSKFLSSDYRQSDGLICLVCLQCCFSTNSLELNHKHTICIQCLKSSELNLGVLFLTDEQIVNSNHEKLKVDQQFLLKKFFQNYYLEVRECSLNGMRENFCHLCLFLGDNANFKYKNNESKITNKKLSSRESFRSKTANSTSHNCSEISCFFDKKNVLDSSSFTARSFLEKRRRSYLDRSAPISVLGTDYRSKETEYRSDIVENELKDSISPSSGMVYISFPSSPGFSNFRDISPIQSPILNESVIELPEPVVKHSKNTFINKKQITFQSLRKTTYFDKRVTSLSHNNETERQSTNSNLSIEDKKLKLFIEYSKKYSFFHKYLTKSSFFQEKSIEYKYYTRTIYILLQFCNTNKAFHILFNPFFDEHDANGLIYLLKQFPIISGFCFYGLARMQKKFENVCNLLINSNNSLVFLDFSFFNLNAKQCLIVQSLLIKCTKIEEIYLANNENMESGFNYLCTGLLVSKNCLKVINLDNCTLNSEQLIALEKFLQNCVCLEVISLQGNVNFHQFSFDFHQALLNSIHSLRRIDLRYCNLKDISGAALEILLKKCDKVVSFHITGFKWRGLTLANICRELVKSSDNLEHLSFLKCDDFSSCNNELANLFQNCKNLKSVCLELKFLGTDFKNILISLKNSNFTGNFDVTQSLVDDGKDDTCKRYRFHENFQWVTYKFLKKQKLYYS